MPKKTVSVEVESSGYDLSEALVAVVSAVRKGGGAAGALAAAITQVQAVISAAESIPADVKEDIWESEKGLAIGVSDLAKAAFGPAS